MKKLVALWIIGFLMGLPCVMFAQSSSNYEIERKAQKEIIKERKEAAKLSKKAIETKAVKEAKKQAKALKKDGWKAAPGSVSLEKQISNLLLRQYELDGNFPKYIIGKSSASASSYGVARKQAITRARVEVATNMEAEIAALTENTDSNVELNANEVQTVAKMLDTSKQLVQQKIGRTDVVFEAYRNVDGNTEVQVGITYDGSIAKSVILELFEKDNAEIKQKLEELTK